MNVPDKIVYLLALIPFCLIWFIFYFRRKDLRKEIISISILIGILSVLTSYYWWTKDWWRPYTITGTIVGVEDFIMGFTTGGIMSVIYNFIFNKRYQKISTKHNLANPYLVGLFMAVLTAWLFSIIGLTSFWASVISMFLVVVYIVFVRRDLLFDSLVSGIAMMFISIFFYLIIILISSNWLNHTYLYGLSGVKVWYIPIEEFIFWFLAGMWVGPFYEFSFGKRLD